MSKILDLKKWVKLQLIKYPQLRDSNERLYCLYLESINYNINNTTKQFLQDMSKRKIPYLDSIARASRSVQEEYPHLRGKYWKKRKKKSVDIKHQIINDKNK